MKKVTKSPATKKSTARWLKLVGAILLFIGVAAMGDAFSDALIYGWLQDLWWLEDFLSGLAFAAGGGAMLFKGFSMDRQLKRFSKYLLVMGDREAMPIDELARTLGYSEKRVEKDLEKMIDKGYFGGKAYLNVELGYLFRSSGAGRPSAASLRRPSRRRRRRPPRLHPPKRRRRAIPASCGTSAGPTTGSRTRFSPPRSTGWRRSRPRSSRPWRRTPGRRSASAPS